VESIVDKYREGDLDMNKWNRLLAILDQVYGFEDKKKSAIRKVGQHFDERTNEHVFHIEYRVRRGGRANKQARKERLASKLAVGDLLRDVHARARH